MKVDAIEHDPDDHSREYIPLPGGWEVQTKGAGSSYRLLDKKTGERHLILSGKDWMGLQAFFTRFAHEVFAATRESASLPGAGAGEPVGWKLVPVEPMPEMLGAWYRYKSGRHFYDETRPADTSDYGAYRAMLASAPASPAPASMEVVSHEAAIGETQPGLSIVRDTQVPASLPSEDVNVRIEHNDIVLPSGRRLYANNAIVGLGEEGELFGGYDQRLHWDDEPLSNEDRSALCLWMARRWTALTVIYTNNEAP